MEISKQKREEMLALAKTWRQRAAEWDNGFKSSVGDELRRAAEELEKLASWEAVAVGQGFIEEVCGSGGERRRVYEDGRVVPLNGDGLVDVEEEEPQLAPSPGLDSQIVDRLAVILNCGRVYVKQVEGGSNSHLSELMSSTEDLLLLGIDPKSVENAASKDFASALEFAKFVAQAHLVLMQMPGNDQFYGSSFDTALGNIVFCLCIENGIDLEDDGGFCNKATPDEIQRYNIGRIDKHLA